MGPVRHRQFIRLMAAVVMFDLAAAGAVFYARSEPAAASGRATTALGGGTATGDPGSGGILSSGRFSNRRGQGRPPAGTADAGKTSETSSSTVTAPGPSTTTSRPAAAPASPGNGTNGAPGANGAPGTNGANGAKGTSTSTNTGQTTDRFTDRSGDTIVDGGGQSRPEPAADIVQSQAVYNPKAVVFAVKTDRSADPGRDPHWAGENTFISWEIDTNGDTVPDFEIQFSLAEGAPVGGVSRSGDDDVASICEAEAGFVTEGYAVAFDPTCIGTPASFSYRVMIYYDTDPANEAAEVLTDVSPDGGLCHPIVRPGP